MNSINYWKTHPRGMRRMIDDMVEVINEMGPKFLLNTFFVRDIDQFLSHDDSKAVIIDMISHLYTETIGYPPPPDIQRRIRDSLNNSLEVYIRFEAIMKLGIMSRDQLIIYQNTGLINVELFPESNGIGYPWKVIKQIAK